MMIVRLGSFVLFALLGFGLLPGVCRGQIDLRADKMDYDADTGSFIGVSNVVIRHRGALLQADYIKFNTKTENATARGNVTLIRDGQTWEGDELTGNFRTKEWDLGEITTQYGAFKIISPVTQHLDEGHLYLEDVIITTCDAEDMEFYAKAKKADMYDEQILRAESITFYLHGTPIMYLPSYTMDLEREQTNFDVLPGYSNRSGPFILTAYSIYLNEYLTSVTHLDYRGKRGVAGGQDLLWKNGTIRDEETDAIKYRPGDKWSGGILGYVTQDDEPYRNMEEESRERAEGIDLDNSRYRLRLSHAGQLDENNNSLHIEANYWSDPQVTEDFFEDEFRLSPDPENRLTLAHTDPNYSASLEVSRQLNDEYFTAVNRLPILTLSVPRIQILDTPFYYESDTSAGLLEKAFSDLEKRNDNSLVDFDSSRFHTKQTLLFPKKYFGFLNLIPQASYLGTYFGKTIGETTQTTISSSSNTNGITTITTNTTTSISNLGSDFRNFYELGLGASFKAFKVLEDGPVGIGQGLRHVIEPHADWTFRPDPDLLPGNLYQFDGIDQLTSNNTLRVGVRNKLQTRKFPTSLLNPSTNNDEDSEETDKNYAIWDFVDIDVYTTLDFNADKNKGEKTIGDWVLDAEIRPNENIKLDMRAAYDTQESEIRNVFTSAELFANDGSFITFEHTYTPSVRSTLQSDYALNPKGKISLEGYSRYNFEEGIFEEQRGLIAYRADCVGYGLGFRWITGDFIESSGGENEDDWKVWVQIWLLAFPKSQLSLR